MGKRVFVLGAMVAAVAVGSVAAFAAGWHTAIAVPGAAALNTGGDARVYSVSCAAAGQCAAGGYYNDGSGPQAFLVSLKRGHWGHAVEVPGTGTLNAGHFARLETVSCGAVGNCSAGGFYRDASTHLQAFVVSEKRGRWGKAVKVPGTAALNKGGSATVYSVSCAAAGECVAGGYYRDGTGQDRAFVVSKKRGRWGHAMAVPGMAALNTGSGSNTVTSVSCVAVGECAAGGGYTNGSGDNEAFVVSQRRGRWGKAIEVPGTATLNAGGLAGVRELSCGAAGECSAGGYYKDGTGAQLAFVVSEKRGHWGKAVEAPGTATLNIHGHGNLLSVSCGSAGECGAGGFYTDASDHFQAFVELERRGHWGQAIEVPGTATLNSGGSAAVNSVSCIRGGACVATGYYLDVSGNSQAFVATERHGRWSTAVEVPGTAALNSGDNAEGAHVSCVATGACAAGGYYEDGAAHVQPFVLSGTVLPKR